MITLYELYWSHYCEKIRWALSYKGLSWRSVKINAFTKKEMQRFPPGPIGIRTVPMIHDSATNRAIYESTSILQYLEDEYPETPSLFPADPKLLAEVFEKLIEFDSVLGIPVSRLGYTQLMLECPTALSDLFLRNQWGGVLAWPIIREISSRVVAMILIKRYDMHLNESLNLFERICPGWRAPFSPAAWPVPSCSCSVSPAPRRRPRHCC